MSGTGCDVAIIGGGPVGASLALALRGSGLDVRLLEARKPESAAADPRALALAYGSRLLLERLGVWQDLPDVTAIKTIHISQRHAFGRAVLRAEELHVPGLGYVLPYHALHGALCRALEAGGIRYLTGAAVTGLDSAADGARVTYRHDGAEHALSARLAEVAHGAGAAGSRCVSRR